MKEKKDIPETVMKDNKENILETVLEELEQENTFSGNAVGLVLFALVLISFIFAKNTQIKINLSGCVGPVVARSIAN